jgi:hypothetical protein
MSAGGVRMFSRISVPPLPASTTRALPDVRTKQQSATDPSSKIRAPFLNDTERAVETSMSRSAGDRAVRMGTATRQLFITSGLIAIPMSALLERAFYL